MIMSRDLRNMTDEQLIARANQLGHDAGHKSATLPALSGDDCDGYTSSDLMFDLGTDARDTAFQDKLAAVWEAAASVAFWDAIDAKCGWCDD